MKNLDEMVAENIYTMVENIILRERLERMKYTVMTLCVFGVVTGFKYFLINRH